MTKSYNKERLAKLYGWDTQMLIKRINTTKGLLKKLKEEAGYNPYKRVFTPKQILIIFEFLGDPQLIP